MSNVYEDMLRQLGIDLAYQRENYIRTGTLIIWTDEEMLGKCIEIIRDKPWPRDADGQPTYYQHIVPYKVNGIQEYAAVFRVVVNGMPSRKLGNDVPRRTAWLS